jgi:hypothetical protein
MRPRHFLRLVSIRLYRVVISEGESYKSNEGKHANGKVNNCVSGCGCVRGEHNSLGANHVGLYTSLGEGSSVASAGSKTVLEVKGLSISNVGIIGAIS